MMFFFDNVFCYSSMCKSAKGRALENMAERFLNVLVQGDDAPVKIACAMREQAAAIDKEYPRGRKTFIDITIDHSGDCGQITAIPVSGEVHDSDKQYFRVHFQKVARTATIPEAVSLVKGGEA